MKATPKARFETLELPKHAGSPKRKLHHQGKPTITCSNIYELNYTC